MRLSSLVCALLAVAATADARVVRTPPPQPEPDRGDFWRNAIEPHADELAVILRRAHEDINTADSVLGTDYDPVGARRTAAYQDAYGMLRYARRLSPQNTEVLALLGRAADELGKTRQAIEAYNAYLQLVVPDKTDGEVAGRLGMAYLRQGDLDAAIRYLRLGLRPLSAPINAQIDVALASALAARGQMSDAIDLLSGALPANIGYYSTEATLVAFALAVYYDRDEQRSAAFDVLDHMKTAMQTGYGQQVQQALVAVRFVPADDKSYFDGLFYESVDFYPQARAAFAIYAATPDAPWRGRALDHVAALDAQRRVAPVAPPPSLTLHVHHHVPGPGPKAIP